MPSPQVSRPAFATPRWLATAALMLVGSCLSGDGRGPTGVRPSDADPAFEISDAVHSAGTAGFYFLPPMVAQPTVSGVFDAAIGTVNPRVVICDVTEGPAQDCGGSTPALREYTTSSTPAIVVDGEKYKVLWDTKEDGFAAGRVYRVYVQAGAGRNRRQLGFADILLTTVPGKAKSLASADVIVMNDGRTLPIHFRIEEAVIVPPGDAASFDVSIASSVLAGAPVPVTVTARDANGLIATGYTGAVTFTSSDAQAELPAQYVFTESDAGVHTFVDAVVLRTAGAATVRAADAGDAAIFGEATVEVQPGAAAKLRLGGVSDEVTAGAPHDLTVTALDEFDNIATGYTGTVQFTSSDAAASLPGAFQFTAENAGTHTFTAGVTFRTAGTQSLDAADAGATSLSASLTATVSAAAAAALRFTTQPSDALAGENILPPVVLTAYDAFDNVATGFVGEVGVALGANPGSAILSGTLTRAAVAGAASFDDLRINAAGTGYTLVASATNLTGATSAPFDVIVPTPVEVRWKNAVSGLWSVAANWSTGAVPTPDQSVLIDVPGTYTVTLDVSATVNGLTLGGGSGTQTLNVNPTRTLTLLSPANVLGTARLNLDRSTVTGSGTLNIAADAALNLASVSTISAPLSNGGTVTVLNDSSTLSGGLTTLPGSLIRIQSIGFGGAVLNVASGFTNNGTIELTGLTSNGVTFNVNGTLVNAPEGTILVLPNGGGTRTIGAPIDNQGTMDVRTSLLLSRPSTGYTNSGVIAVSGGTLEIRLSGAMSFTNTGHMTIAQGRTVRIAGVAPSAGAFSNAPGATLDGPGTLILNGMTSAAFNAAVAVGSLILESSTVHFAQDLSTETTGLTVAGATVNGPGTITNAAGRTLSLSIATINAPLVNAGTIIGLGATRINGSLTTAAGSLMRVLSSGFGGTSLTVADGFTNNGTLELTSNTANGASFTVTNGTLLNAEGGSIAVLRGAGGSRTISAAIDNRGTFSVGAALALPRPASAYHNSGLFSITGGNVDMSLTSARTFTNAGTLTIAAGRALVIGGFAPNGGSAINESGGSIEGQGNFQLGSSVPFSNAGSVTIALARFTSSLTSTGTFSPDTTDFLAAATIPVGAGFAYKSIRVFVQTSTFAGSVNLAGNLIVGGTNSNLAIGAHEISVAGDLATRNTGALTMQNAAGVLNVSGNASFGGASTNGRLTTGTLRVGGSFTQGGGSAAAFAATGSHVTVLNGSGAQSVTFGNPGTATTLSHFQHLRIENASAAGVSIGSAVFANGQLRTPAGASVARISATVGDSLQVAGLDAAGLVFDRTPLRVVNGQPLARFNDVTFQNMDPAGTQLRLSRLADVVTFNNLQFLTAPTSGFYLHLVDTDLAAPVFTVTLQGTQPATHGGRIIESIPGQLIGWPFE